ncbi:MAG: preprotein translocase subunit SecE [Phycisphaerales bacterium]|nr:preprotein translocase subunit SecE [Phycisphaerales bacterium]
MSVVAVGLLGLLGAYWIGGIFWSDEHKYTATGVGLAFCALALWGIWHFFAASPRSVDFLVATEAEMKKVNWSTRREIVGSTIVVIFTAFSISLFCYLFDLGFYFAFVFLRVLDPTTTS